MTREPEMVKAYRDTWELGLHSYLTYLRDRLPSPVTYSRPAGASSSRSATRTSTTCARCWTSLRERELHRADHVREDRRLHHEFLAGVSDYLLLYAKDRERLKYREILRGEVARHGRRGAV